MKKFKTYEEAKAYFADLNLGKLAQNDSFEQLYEVAMFCAEMLRYELPSGDDEFWLKLHTKATNLALANGIMILSENNLVECINKILSSEMSAEEIAKVICENFDMADLDDDILSFLSKFCLSQDQDRRGKWLTQLLLAVCREKCMRNPNLN